MATRIRSDNAEERAMAEEAKRLAKAFDVPEDEVMELVKLGFEEVNRESLPRLVINSTGREKCGKTHFAIHTTPDPIALIDFDIGTEGMVNKGGAPRRILHRQFTLRQQSILDGRTPTQNEYKEEWEAVQLAIRTAIKSKFIRTIVMDTATEAWELARLAEFGKLAGVVARNYMGVNSDFSGLVRAVYGRPGLNAVFIDKVKKEYKNDKWAGKYERTGFGDLPFAAQLVIEHYRDDDEDEGYPFGIRVMESRHDEELKGEEFSGAHANFKFIARRIFPKTPKDYWE